jgi:two-component system, NtrC family, sensor kinase
MRRITSRFVMLIATAAVAPLVIYGGLSISSLRSGTRESVNQGNVALAGQVATRVKLYMDNTARILRSTAQELGETSLAQWQQSRILKNHVLEFPEFHEISLFDAGGRVVATSRVGPPETKVSTVSSHATQGVEVAPIFLDTDGLPTTDLSIRLKTGTTTTGWLIARISLEDLWRFVDQVRVGSEGYALVLSSELQVIAHGNPAEKRLVALPVDPQHPLPEVDVMSKHGESQFAEIYTDRDNREKLAAVARVPDINWTVIVEQPTDEAYAIASSFQQQLVAAIALALLGTILLGWVWARSFITRIFALTAATQALAEGRMDQRVAIGGRDEIHQLGDSFNSMADRLVELQEDVRKQERQAMFGRIAAGLVHDLSHPIQNIGNSCKLIVKMFDDHEYRETFKRTVEREMVMLKRVLDDLRNIARPIPLERFPVEIQRSVAEVVDSMQPHADTAGVTLQLEASPEPAFIEGDVFALGRVYRNLILNAIQATAPGGLITVGTETRTDRVFVRVQDTGCGIPADRLTAIFEDFVTTKRRGLGLGLAISRKIVDQLGGQISVTSDVGVGTTFVLEFPRTRARPMLVAG